MKSDIILTSVYNSLNLLKRDLSIAKDIVILWF